MDHQFTEEVKTWLELSPDVRDYDKGNELLLQLSNNRIRYRNFAFNAKAKADYIVYELNKYLKFRLKDLTHQQVTAMQEQVDAIPALQDHKAENAEFRAGKRADHDLLPESIQALYSENLGILQRMREVHLKLRSLSLENATCPDSERYPFLKELIELDTKRHANWEAYDKYVIGSGQASSSPRVETLETVETVATLEKKPAAKKSAAKAKAKSKAKSK